MESELVERCPDLLVVLDGDMKVVRASAGLRSVVPLVEPGMEFARSLEDPSPERLAQALSLERDSGVAFNLDVMHRGRERLVPATYRFYGLEKPFVAGLGREIAATGDLTDQVDALRRRHQEMLSQLASMTGRLRELARNDSLTGLLNRRAFLDQAEHEWARHWRHRHPVACFALDVDAFKGINDTHGHAAGDAVLQHIGALLRATLRASDVPARTGGDEFIALMPDTTIDGAAATAERLLARIAAHPVTVFDKAFETRISIGVCDSVGCSSLEELLARADGALYRAKKEGKNRVCRD